MIHMRTDHSDLNSERRFRCGIGPKLPDGDKWVGQYEYGLHGMVDCPVCRGEPVPVGIPASRLNGNAAKRHEDPEAWDNWVRLSQSWGYD